MPERHRWVIWLLEDLIVYARSYNFERLADALRRAQSAAEEIIGRLSRDDMTRFEHFRVSDALDELEDFADEHGLTDVRRHILDARKAWAEVPHEHRPTGRIRNPKSSGRLH